MCVLFLHHSLLKYFGFNDIFCRFFFIPTGYFYSIELMKKKNYNREQNIVVKKDGFKEKC